MDEISEQTETMRYNLKTIKKAIYWIWLFSMFDKP